MTHWSPRPAPRLFPLALSRPTPGGTPPRGLVRRAIAWVGDALERRRSRHLLLLLEPRLLRDIGLSPGEAVTEAEKPFWRR